MRQAFFRMFWGFLLVLLDLRINGFDVLPDIVGWILIVSALGTIAGRSPRFRLARLFAVPALIASILELFPLRSSRIDAAVGIGPSSVGFYFEGLALAILVTIALFVIDLLMVYNICAGIWELASERGLLELVAKARRRWNLYLALSIAGVVLFLIFFTAARDGTAAGDLEGLFGIFIAFGLFAIVVIILFLALLRLAGHQLGAGEPPGFESP